MKWVDKLSDVTDFDLLTVIFTSKKWFIHQPAESQVVYISKMRGYVDWMV